jgi:hypothetical protein
MSVEPDVIPPTTVAGDGGTSSAGHPDGSAATT